MAHALGDAVRIEMEKWGGRPHWHIPGRWLGTDDFGDWIGIPAGTLMVRPGLEIVSQHDQVGLVPTGGTDVEGGGVPPFPRAPPPVWGAGDLAPPPVWDGDTVRAVHLDLDVIRGRQGDVVVDDE